MKIIGIIPARAGSKGVKNKNMQCVNGKPLVAHAAEVALASKVFDRILVTTNDDEVIKFLSTYDKIEIPYKRPEHLASDTALISDAVAHLLDWLLVREQYQPYAFMLLEPTCPLRTVHDIHEALTIFKTSHKPCVISVSEPQQHPSNMIVMRGDTLEYCLERIPHSRGRQDFLSSWFINGAVYLTQTEFFKHTHQIYDLNACALYKMPSERAFDINTPHDLALVRAHLSLQKEEEFYA